MRVVWSSWPEHRAEGPPVGALRVALYPHSANGAYIEVLTQGNTGPATWWDATGNPLQIAAAIQGMATELAEHAKRAERAARGLTMGSTSVRKGE